MRVLWTIAIGIALWAKVGLAADAPWADAAEAGDLALVRALIEKKSNVNAPQADGTTAVDVVVVRDGKNLKGRLIAIVLVLFGKSILGKELAKTVAAIEARNAGTGAAAAAE